MASVSKPGRWFAKDLMAGKVAIVTGGGSGIGLAIAIELAAAGADVVITSRSADRLAQAELAIAEQTGRVCASLPADVRDEDQVAALRDFVAGRYGPATVLVNNAAANFRVAAERMTRRALSSVVETDLFGTVTVTREFFPDMKAAGGGAVLSIVVALADRGFPGFSHAGAAKAAIMSLTGLLGAGVGQARDPAEHDRARPGAHAGCHREHVRAPAGEHRRHVRAFAALDPAGAARHPRGHRGGSGLPLLGRGVVDHRREPDDRRWHEPAAQPVSGARWKRGHR
jgi:NADP-dependent 3-hydroxy acid dehydrogenase YdfG